MRRCGKRFIFVGCASLIVALAVVLWRKHDSGPAYRGRSLEEWLIVHRNNYPEDPASKEAAEAIRQIGTNAIPSLLVWIQDVASRTRQIELWNAANRLPRGLTDNRLGHWVLDDRKGRPAELALDGFQILGPQASAAIPDLTRMLNQTNYNADLVSFALGSLGTNGLPPLVAVVTNPSAPNRQTVIFCLGMLRTNAYPAVPSLVACLADSDSQIVNGAVRALGHLKHAPEIVVPALVNCLQAYAGKHLTTEEENHVIGLMAALEVFGERSRPALPLLFNLLNDSHPWMRENATNAVRAIAPEVFPPRSQL